MMTSNAAGEEETCHDISEIVITMTNDIEEAPPLSLFGRLRWSIYRVPKNMREANETAYNPQLVSIGPFHYKDPRLQYMEQQKLLFLKRLLSMKDQPRVWSRRDYYDSESEEDDLEGIELEESPQLHPGDAESSSSNQSNLKLKTLAIAMKKLESKARGCYSETFSDIDSKSFVMMMIRDGCFVVELLRLYWLSEMEFIDDPIFMTRWTMPILQRDFLLLENQLPLFVLQKIFDLTASGQGPSLEALTVNFFDPLMPRDKRMLKTLRFHGNHNHLLGLFRSSFLTSKQPKSVMQISSFRERDINDSVRKLKLPKVVSVEDRQLVHERQLIPFATELKEAGVEFEERETDDLLDIKFNEGVLEIPPLHMDDHTGPILVNFVAYEQCHHGTEPHFTNYVLFFNNLLKSYKDVELLHQNGIINHVLGTDEDVADLFNKLSTGVVLDIENQYLSEQLKDIKSYYKTKWRMWRVAKAKWVDQYFSNPWSFISLLAASILLMLTMIQTVFSIFSYFHPSS